MTIKRLKCISIIIIFLLCFLTHYLYNWFPNFLFSIFFPVNESIWEHLKMMVTAIIIWKAFEYFLLKKYRLNHNNFLLSIFIEMFLSIIIFLMLYLPIYHFIESIMIINLSCLFITIILTSIIGYYILKQNHIKYVTYPALIGIVLLYTIFGILTYHPIENFIFFDPLNEMYGINIFNI